jgi:hypothetical protein
VFGAGTGGDDSETEARAIDCSVSMVFHVAGSEVGPFPATTPAAARQGQLWVIRSDDGTLSAGVQREVDAWDGFLSSIVIRTWAEWEREIASEVTGG